SDDVQLEGLNTDRDGWTGEIAIPVNQDYLDIDGQRTPSGIGIHSVNVKLKSGDDNWQCGEIDWRYTPTGGKEQAYQSVLNAFITKSLQVKAEKHTSFKRLSLTGKADGNIKMTYLNRIYVAPIYENGILGGSYPVNYHNQQAENFEASFYLDNDMYNSGKLQGLRFVMRGDTYMYLTGWDCYSARFKVVDKSGVERQVCEKGNNRLTKDRNLDIYASTQTKALNIDIKTADVYNAGTNGHIFGRINYQDGTQSVWYEFDKNAEFYRNKLAHRTLMGEMQGKDFKPIKSVTLRLTGGDSSWKCEYVQFEGHAKVEVNQWLYAGKPDDSVTVNFK
ncbi:MAG: hypothetical protein HUJ62_07670, partial [Streptococcus gallolyticus]|nr:hypothetical protein [Streptococcus gallolyticus]